jgi:hypothetical protein
MSAVNKPLSIAIPANLPENLSRHFPAEVAVVRYDVDGTDTHDVDVLVPPSFGPKAPEVLPRIRCRYIQMASAGVETMLPLVPAGVTLCNAQGVHDSSTAEWVVTAILASLKWLPFYAQHQFAGHWAAREESDPFYEATFGAPNSVGNVVLTEEVKGSQVLIVGYGSIGKAIEQRLLPFEPRAGQSAAGCGHRGADDADDPGDAAPDGCAAHGAYATRRGAGECGARPGHRHGCAGGGSLSAKDTGRAGCYRSGAVAVGAPFMEGSRTPADTPYRGLYTVISGEGLSVHRAAACIAPARGRAAQYHSRGVLKQLS